MSLGEDILTPRRGPHHVVDTSVTAGTVTSTTRRSGGVLLKSTPDLCKEQFLDLLPLTGSTGVMYRNNDLVCFVTINDLKRNFVGFLSAEENLTSFLRSISRRTCPNPYSHTHGVPRSPSVLRPRRGGFDPLPPKEQGRRLETNSLNHF